MRRLVCVCVMTAAMGNVSAEPLTSVVSLTPEQAAEAKGHQLILTYEACALAHAKRYARTTATPTEIIVAVKSKCAAEREALHDQCIRISVEQGTPEYQARGFAEGVMTRLDKEYDPDLTAAILDARIPNK